MVGTDSPLQHSNPAFLLTLAAAGIRETSRTTARSVMKQIAALCDQTLTGFPGMQIAPQYWR